MQSIFRSSKGVILFVVVLLFSTNSAICQGGLHIYVGGTSMTNNLDQYTPSNTTLSGYHAGGDFQFGGESMYFMLGLQYHGVDIIPSAKFSAFDAQANLGVAKLRGGLGFNVFRITELIKVRLKVLGSIDSFVVYDQARDYIGSPPLNSATASGIGGLGVSIGPMRLDLEYHRGLINAYNQVSDSHFHYWLFNAGVFF